MNHLVCTILVIGTLVSGHTIRYKRGIPDEPVQDNQIHQQEVAETSQIPSEGYQTSQNDYSSSGVDQSGGSYSSPEGKISHITITKEVPIHQPVPVPVEVERKVPYPIPVRVLVPVDQPYYVKIYKPYPVAVYKDIPYAVYKDVPVPVKVAVEVPYPVKVPVLVPQPFPIPIDVPVKIPIADLKVIKKAVVLEQQERENGGGDIPGDIGGGFGGSFDGENFESAAEEIESTTGDGSAEQAVDIGGKY